MFTELVLKPIFTISHLTSPSLQPPLKMPQYLKKSTGSAAGSTSAQESVTSTVKSVINDIRLNGDSAVRTYSQKFDKWSPPSFLLSKSEIDSIIATVPEQTIKDIKEVQSNVRAFAQAQRESLKDFEIEIRPGIHLGQKNIPINAVGAYVPFLSLLPSTSPRHETDREK